MSDKKVCVPNWESSGENPFSVSKSVWKENLRYMYLLKPALWAFNSLYNREMVLFNVKENRILWNICRQVWDRVKKGVQSIQYGPLIKMIDDNKRSTYLNQVQAISVETDKHTALH